MANPPNEVTAKALDLLIAVKQQQQAGIAPAPVQQQQGRVGGKELLHMAAEALLATAHLIAAAVAPKSADISAAQSSNASADLQQVSLEDLLEARKQLSGS